MPLDKARPLSAILLDIPLDPNLPIRYWGPVAPVTDVVDWKWEGRLCWNGTFIPSVSRQNIIVCDPVTCTDMTGRDARSFVTANRSRDNGDLVVRMKNGFGSSKYKPVDYQQLHSLTEAKKLASSSIQLKVQKILHASKITKDQMLMKQHSQVWWKENKRLNESRDKVELHLETFLEEKSKTCQFFSEMGDFEQQLSEERDEYKACTIHPIWQLRDDLKHRICQLQHHSFCKSQMENDFDPVNIMKQVESVKSQQKALIEKLLQEQRDLEHELLESDLQECVDSEEITCQFGEVPAVLQQLYCPYPELWVAILTEYQQLVGLYQPKMKELDCELKDIDRDCEWTKEDHWIFQTIISQYPSDLPNRRTLYMDMLSKHLPRKPRQDLVSHEKMWDFNRFNKDQRRALMESWTRYRKDFIIKAAMTIAESGSIYETELIVANDRKRQQEICSELKEKVTQWRIHQEEAARLESSIAAGRQQEEEHQEKQRRETEKLLRANGKEKIQKYKAEKQLAWEEQQSRDLQRLEELKEIMAQQAEKDRERVVYRQQLLEKRLSERKEEALHEEQIELERQRRLEALRQQVAVIAEFDPVRMMSDTRAWKARLGIGAEEEIVLQKPLFDLYTYNEQQIICDPRIRVEMALREAGLHNTNYAKEILPKILPLRPPRKDMESTIFKK
ncbi:coiled-coil domain-containing protein 148 isoform X2 [Rhinoderma darwinii]|uniref:coiled-coil domain-containing protein 148 isoform X2 n=1 Tax=Rhinoderma darwinii TaxID=43563 RepID=UPI003F6689EC